MPVSVKEFIRVRDDQGAEHEGEALAGNLISIQEGNDIYYGVPLARTKIQTRVVCDAGKDCLNSTIDDTFISQPKTIEFFGESDNNPEFLKDLAQVKILADGINGEKQVFCTQACLLHYLKKDARLDKGGVVDISGGKGFKTFEVPQPANPIPQNGNSPEVA